jgi:hypothetical protein
MSEPTDILNSFPPWMSFPLAVVLLFFSLVPNAFEFWKHLKLLSARRREIDQLEAKIRFIKAREEYESLILRYPQYKSSVGVTLTDKTLQEKHKSEEKLLSGQLETILKPSLQTNNPSILSVIFSFLLIIPSSVMGPLYIIFAFYLIFSGDSSDFRDCLKAGLITIAMGVLYLVLAYQSFKTIRQYLSARRKPN